MTQVQAEAKGIPVVVTTEHRGVFFGWLDGDITASQMRLTQAQMCVYWSARTRGVLGLAAAGPDKDCKVGPAVPAITVDKVTSVIEATAEAVKRWQGAPWS